MSKKETMEIHIEWDRKYYPCLCSDDSYISKDASACLDILKEIGEDKTERFEITKKNLNYLIKRNASAYTAIIARLYNRCKTGEANFHTVRTYTSPVIHIIVYL